MTDFLSEKTALALYQQLLINNNVSSPYGACQLVEAIHSTINSDVSDDVSEAQQIYEHELQQLKKDAEWSRLPLHVQKAVVLIWTIASYDPDSALSSANANAVIAFVNDRNVLTEDEWHELSSGNRDLSDFNFELVLSKIYEYCEASAARAARS